jgi:hypothetical protein
MARRPLAFIGYPTDHLLAVLPDPTVAASAAADLAREGIPDADITILCGEEGAQRLDGTGATHGLVARLRRTLSFTVMDQMPDMAWYERAVRDGQAVLMIRVRGDAARAAVVATLRRHGAHFINHYGRFATEEIARWTGPEPDVADLLKR